MSRYKPATWTRRQSPGLTNRIRAALTRAATSETLAAQLAAAHNLTATLHATTGHPEAEPRHPSRGAAPC